MPPDLRDFFVNEEVRNTDLYTAVFFGVVAILFAIRAELREEHTMVELRWLRFAIVICAIIAILLVIRIAVVTTIFIVTILSHTF